MDVMSVHFVLLCLNLVVPKCKFLDVMIMNGILLMYMMSTASVILPCSSNSPSGNSSHELIVTFSGIFLVVLHFSEPKFGPNMSSACDMSALVTSSWESDFSAHNLCNYLY